MISLVCVGDINLKFRDKELEFEDEIIDIFNTADLRFGNLETVISNKSGIIEEKAYNFKADIKKLDLLSPLKFDVLNIANNHTLDFGQELKNDTKKNVLEKGIKVIDNNENLYNVEYFDVKNKKIAFIGIQYFDKKNSTKLNNLIKKLKKNVDYVILSIHWGIELCFSPTINQKKWGHELIDNGVDLIIGHHPHVLQAIEKYKKGIIIYSLGNFQFEIEDEDIEFTQYTEIVKIYLSEEKLEVKEYPIFITKEGIPTRKLNLSQLEKYKNLKIKCQSCLKNISYINVLKEMSTYNMEQHMLAWKKRELKKEKNLLIKKLKWFLNPQIMLAYIFYLFNKNNL